MQYVRDLDRIRLANDFRPILRHVIREFICRVGTVSITCEYYPHVIYMHALICGGPYTIVPDVRAISLLVVIVPLSTSMMYVIFTRVFYVNRNDNFFLLSLSECTSTNGLRIHDIYERESCERRAISVSSKERKQLRRRADDE